MKRVRFGILLLCAGLLLCACGAAAGDPAPATAAPTAAPEPDPIPAPASAEPTATPEVPPAASGAQTVLFTHLEGDGTGGEGARIQGLDADGTPVWERVFSVDECTELTPIEEIGLWRDRYYFNYRGVITCLALADGETLWENGEFRGASISALVDSRNGNIYACGYYGPDFFAADALGNTLVRFGSVAEDYFWPSDMRWAGEDLLEIRFYGGIGEGYTDSGLPYYVDLRDYSIRYSTDQIDLSENERYWANIFLSDFIEQNLTGFDMQTAGYYEMAEFTRTFCRINRPSALNREEYGESMSLEDANRLCQRFFDRSMSFVNPDYTQKESELLHTGEDGAVWRYEKGRLYFPPAKDAVHNRFAAVRKAWAQEAGALRFSFDIYALNEKEYAAQGMDAALYRLTPEQAEQLAAQGRVVRLGTGTALVRPYPDGAAQLYGMPAGSVGYWLLELTTDLPEAHG